jgi:pyruvate formate lyase activating enzyme
MSLARACREKGIHTCLDTSGAAPWSVLEKVARTMDLILYDIKAVDPGMHRRLTGISSKAILENLENLNQSGARVSLRFPFIPGYTDTRENIQEILEFLTLRTGYRTIHLLPFHHTAKGKYEALGRKDPMAGVEPPANEAVAEAAALFQARGFKTIIGG